MQVFKDFPEDSRVWLYQSNRALTSTEKNFAEEELAKFTKEWAAHGKQLWAKAALVNPFFIAVVVDECITPPSGCSIDASVKFIKDLGKEIGVDFFSRMQITYRDNDTLKQIAFNQIATLKNDVLIYDALTNRLDKLRNNWPVAIKDSNYAVHL